MFLRLLSVVLPKIAPGYRLRAFSLCCIAVLGVFLCHSGAVLAADEEEITFQPRALAYTGTYQLRQLEPNLTGSGVGIVALCRSLTYVEGQPQNDYRMNVEHKCFDGKSISFYDDDEFEADVSAHSTAIGSILLGEDPDGYHPEIGRFYYQGAVPDANMAVCEFWNFVINNVFTATAPSANVITMSIGSQFEDWWTRGIDSMAEHSAAIFVAGVGNGSNVYDPVLYPAAGANVLGVGVVGSVSRGNLTDSLGNFVQSNPEISSCGPTDDGRCKPDIVAPGNCLVADVNSRNGYEATGSWSSFAAPVVAGTVGLLVQKAAEDANIGPAVLGEGGNCIMKAILMNSAKKPPYWHKGKISKTDDHEVPLDYVQGAGVLDAVGAYEHLSAGPMEPGEVAGKGWDNNVLIKNGSEGLEKVYKLKVAEPAGKLITATLVWNKHFEDEYPFAPMPKRDSNLRLELWAIDADNPVNDYLLDYSDSSVDNVEHIYCTTEANFSEYELVVSFSDSNEPGDSNEAERYAVAWSTAKGAGEDSILWSDLNSDGLCNSADLVVLLNNFASALKGDEDYLLGDINNDGAIDFEDLHILADRIHKDEGSGGN